MDEDMESDLSNSELLNKYGVVFSLLVQTYQANLDQETTNRGRRGPEAA